MRSQERRRAFGTLLGAVAFCASCTAQVPAGFAPRDGSVDGADHLDGATDATGGGDASSSSDGGAADSLAPEAEDPTDDAPADDGSVDTGAADTGATDGATADALDCSVGSGADYQASCTGCSIGASCLLTCTSCTTMAQTQNPNPSVQLPCPGTTSVQNDNGVLACQ
jgi:hypothetical protein